MVVILAYNYFTGGNINLIFTERKMCRVQMDTVGSDNRVKGRPLDLQFMHQKPHSLQLTQSNVGKL